MPSLPIKPLLASLFALTACGKTPASGPTAGGAVAGCMSRAYDTIGGPFALIDHTGADRTQEDFKGRASLIYFGFTYCPDICPATLVGINQAYQRLPEGVEPPQTLLITVDPERDTPEALATYVSVEAFPDNLVGLTGSQEQVTTAAEGFVAHFERIDTPKSLSEYTMDHTSLLYLMDENWELATFFTESMIDPDSMASCLAQHLG